MQRTETSPGMRVVRQSDWGPDLGLVENGQWREIVGPGLGAACRSMYAVEFEAGGRTARLTHGVEAVYYVVKGEVTVTEFLSSERQENTLTEGSMLHIQPGATYAITADREARIVGGPSPVDPSLGKTPSLPRNDPGITLFHRDEPGLLVPFISKDARLVVWLGAGAVTANMNYVVLEPGERNKEHVHGYSEDTIHILEGHGTAENVTNGERFLVGPGDTIHIEVGCWHAVAADQGEQLVSVGGPCPADTDMLRAAGVDLDAVLSRA
jgi:quercetin dioxygenase-like cupin family protein